MVELANETKKIARFWIIPLLILKNIHSPNRFRLSIVLLLSCWQGDVQKDAFTAALVRFATPKWCKFNRQIGLLCNKVCIISPVS